MSSVVQQHQLGLFICGRRCKEWMEEKGNRLFDVACRV